MTAERCAVGDVVDGQGVKLTLDDGDLVASVVVLAKVIDADGKERLTIGWSEGQSWLERAGMLRVAEASEPINREGDDSP